MNLRQILPPLVVFAVAFGYIEAAVVIYLRALSAPFRIAAGLSATDLFPLMTPAHVMANPVLLGILQTELIREFCTLVLLAAAGWMMAQTGTARFAGFLIAFGVWDITFYLFLKLRIGWPESLFTPDILFLLPVPWWGPVLSPVLGALAMIGGGVLYLARPCPLRWHHWLGIVGGGFVMVVAFCWDFRLLMAGGVPRDFFWSLYLIGLAITVGSFAHAWRR